MMVHDEYRKHQAQIASEVEGFLSSHASLGSGGEVCLLQCGTKSYVFDLADYLKHKESATAYTGTAD